LRKARKPIRSGPAPATASRPAGTGSRFGRAVLDSLHANVLVTDPTFTVVYVNPWAADTPGRSLLGTNLIALHENPRELEAHLKDPDFRTAGATFTVGEATLGAHVTVDHQTATTRDISANLAEAAERARHMADFVAGARRP
jgi:hypothetical protein